jgi:hypothetical protein
MTMWFVKGRNDDSLMCGAKISKICYFAIMNNIEIGV